MRTRKEIFFDTATESNFQLRSSFQKLKCPLRKINSGQLALPHIGPTFWNKIPDILRRTNNLKSLLNCAPCAHSRLCALPIIKMRLTRRRTCLYLHQ